LETGIEVALKKVKLDDERRREVTKEVLIHKLLSHKNIIKFIDSFEYSDNFYIVQELAAGGELFEQIEPDVGFPEKVAHFYFVQLIRSIVRGYALIMNITTILDVFT
jgi:serine/threonine protein kinase